MSPGGHKLAISEEFIHVGTTYHKRPYSEDTNDLKTCNTYSVSFLILLPFLQPLIRAVPHSHGRSEHISRSLLWLEFMCKKVH